jgi:hypothetical protein
VRDALEPGEELAGDGVQADADIAAAVLERLCVAAAS